MVKIGIDPGHGGTDPGAVAANGLQEKDVTLPVGLKLKELLQNTDTNVVISRTEDVDVSLAERVNLFNQEKVDLIISVHINSSENPAARYISTFILGPGGQAEKVAHSIQKEIVRVTGWPDGGIRTANFYLLRKTDAPAVLLEIGFISNPATAILLAQQSIQHSLTRAIFRGLATYLGLKTSDFQGHWAENAIQQVLDAGIMSGYPDGTFRPDQEVTRAELATVLVKLLPKFN